MHEVVLVWFDSVHLCDSSMGCRLSTASPVTRIPFHFDVIRAPAIQCV